ncbi:MAG: hypothetical protein GX638_14820 [Crenarchaeota archaeon]|nr:hypothetical protein [Thermoproteota archaeon]
MKKNRNINEDKYDDIIQRQNERRQNDRNTRDVWKNMDPDNPYRPPRLDPEKWKRMGLDDDLERQKRFQSKERDEKAREYLKSRGVDFQEFARLIESYDKSRGKILKEWQSDLYNVKDYGPSTREYYRKRYNDAKAYGMDQKEINKKEREMYDREKELDQDEFEYNHPLLSRIAKEGERRWRQKRGLPI